jgi:hypothetical protein
MMLVSLKFKIVFLRAEAVSESDEDGKTILDPSSPKSFGSDLTYCTGTVEEGNFELEG